MGWVVTVVDTGDLSQSCTELLMRNPDMEKPARTARAQSNLVVLLPALEIWLRPWMVEDSRNSLTLSMLVLVLQACRC